MIFNPAAECMNRDEIKALQLERLRSIVKHVYANVAFYRERMDSAGVSPDDINTLDDLASLPFTNKTDLRDNYPFGLFAVPMEDIVRIHASSGTTGKPTTVGYTKDDIATWAECAARCIGCAGGTPTDTLQVSYGYGLFTGGLGMHYGGEAMGATVVPTSSGNTKRQIMLMQDYGTNLLCCTPSYALMLAETMQAEGIDPSTLNLRAGIFGAEPWTEGMRSRLEQLMQIDALDIYGLSETMGPGVAMECKEGKHGLHIWEDHFLIEIVDPATGEVLPEGETGELVITTLTKQGMPTVRYRTHDLTSIISEPGKCGRTHRKISRLKGRTDDMLIIRGVNVFPSQIETVLTSIEGVEPHYLIIVDRVNNTDTLDVHVELSPKMFSDEVREIEALRARIAREMQAALGLAAKVKLVGPHQIERSEGKSVRVIDKRKLYQD